MTKKLRKYKLDNVYYYKARDRNTAEGFYFYHSEYHITIAKYKNNRRHGIKIEVIL